VDKHDPYARMTVSQFLARAWKAANDKAPAALPPPRSGALIGLQFTWQNWGTTRGPCHIGKCDPPLAQGEKFVCQTWRTAKPRVFLCLLFHNRIEARAGCAIRAYE